VLSSSLSSSDERKMGDSLVPACNFVDGIASQATAGLGFWTALRAMVKRWEVWLELESESNNSLAVDRTLFRSGAQMLSRSQFCERKS